MPPKSEISPHVKSPEQRASAKAQQAAADRSKERVRKGWLRATGTLDRDALHDRDAMRREFQRDNE